MRVDFYTLGRCECRAKRGARRERTTRTKNGENSQNFSRERQRLRFIKTIYNENEDFREAEINLNFSA